MLVADWLTELHCEVAATVNTVPLALQVAGQVPLDAALLDVNLGGDNSFLLADELLRTHIPVAFITGRDSHSLPERFRAAPILAKPFDFSAIERLLHRLLAPAGEPTL